jgi:hypothetical protein
MNDQGISHLGFLTEKSLHVLVNKLPIDLIVLYE